MKKSIFIFLMSQGKKIVFFGCCWLFLTNCNNLGEKNTNEADKAKEFDINAVKKVIQENLKKWDIGLKKKDIKIIADLYDKNAHYLPNAENAIHGKEAIAEFWKPAIGLIEDLKLDMETLEGTKEILYETGTGTSLVKASDGHIDKFQFKYMNVWKLQSDGTYKVVIDTYNDLKPKK